MLLIFAFLPLVISAALLDNVQPFYFNGLPLIGPQSTPWLYSASNRNPNIANLAAQPYLYNGAGYYLAQQNSGDNANSSTGDSSSVYYGPLPASTSTSYYLLGANHPPPHVLPESPAHLQQAATNIAQAVGEAASDLAHQKQQTAQQIAPVAAAIVAPVPATTIITAPALPPASSTAPAQIATSHVSSPINVSGCNTCNSQNLPQAAPEQVINTPCADGAFRQTIIDIRRIKNIGSIVIERDPVGFQAAETLVSCLRSASTPQTCTPPATAFFGYIQGSCPRDALQRVLGQVFIGGGMDEWGRPLIQVDKKRNLQEVITDPGLKRIQGSAAWDPRYNRFLYVILYD